MVKDDLQKDTLIMFNVDNDLYSRAAETFCKTIRIFSQSHT